MESEREQQAELAELTAEEMIRYGERLLDVGKRLILQAAELRGLDEGLASQLPEDEERDINRYGDTIRMGEAVKAAQELHEEGMNPGFTATQFEQKLGLKRLPARKWLKKMMDNTPHPIVRREGYGAGSRYLYTGPVAVPDPRERPESARQVEQMAGVGADRAGDGRAVPYTGKPVGSSGKPGRDRKVSQSRKVKRSKDSFIGGG